VGSSRDSISEIQVTNVPCSSEVSRTKANKRNIKEFTCKNTQKKLEPRIWAEVGAKHGVDRC
jgi:hypothetical protein